LFYMGGIKLYIYFMYSYEMRTSHPWKSVHHPRNSSRIILLVTQAQLVVCTRNKSSQKDGTLRPTKTVLVSNR